MPRGKYLNSSNIFVILEIASSDGVERRENIIKVLLNEYRKLLFSRELQASCHASKPPEAAKTREEERKEEKKRLEHSSRSLAARPLVSMWPNAKFINYETDTSAASGDDAQCNRQTVSII
jgi:hypothetical protein